MNASPHLDTSMRCGQLCCPRCGLSIEVRPGRTAIRHCPRCVARRVIVELFSSTLPADVLYEENSLPRADDELAPASTPSSGKLRQPAQVDDNLRRAQPLALVAKRPMAMSAYGDRHAWVKDASGTGGEDLPFVQDVWGGAGPTCGIQAPIHPRV
jgi:hypothetical protein